MITGRIKVIGVQAFSARATDRGVTMGDKRLKPQTLRCFDIVVGCRQPGAVTSSCELRHRDLFS
jgi:hypothetical protein